jgi:nucleoside-specific outer membrane channel protein Tsx
MFLVNRTVLFLPILILPLIATAEMNWMGNSLTLLHGEDYRLNYSLDSDDSERNVLTFEHASGHSWGDIFLFVDRLESTENNRGVYGEFSPRLSYEKFSGEKISVGPISDVLLAATIEHGDFDDEDHLSLSDGHFTNTLLGGSVDLDIPGFKFMQLSVYRRLNEYGDNSWQLTTSWAIPFAIGSGKFLYDGYVDWRSPLEGDCGSNCHNEFNVTSQLKWDIGSALTLKPGELYVGIEYVYWNDKYGLEDGVYEIDSNESNVNLLLKWHF